MIKMKMREELDGHSVGSTLHVGTACLHQPIPADKKSVNNLAVKKTFLV